MSDFERFVEPIKRFRLSMQDRSLPKELLLSSEGELSVYYAPFDYINTQARVAICGITPGLQQALLALCEAKRQLLAGASIGSALKKAKETASFGGAMRSNLVSMLDHIGISRTLGLDSCEQLFSTHTHLVHYTSALRYPVFRKGENYSGTPNMISTSFLRSQVEKRLPEELGSLLSSCIYIPLGPKVTEVLSYLASRRTIEPARILDGMPHPSGANAERISYFLGKKRKEALSSKTSPDQIDKAKSKLLIKLAAM